MAYVAPNWKNGQAPALDAAALQAISDAIVANQTKNTQQDSSISSLQTAVNGKSRVATGSYTGTGTYGSSNPNSITFPFTPKLVWIYGTKSSSVGLTDIEHKISSSINVINFIVPFNQLTTSYSSDYGLGYKPSSIAYLYSKKASNTLYWYAQEISGYSVKGDEQLNTSGVSYYWVAFG